MSNPKYLATRDSGIEWLGEIPSHWGIHRIKTTIRFHQNGTWGEEPVGDANDMVCVRVADFDRERLVIGTDQLTTRNIAPREQRSRLLKSGDLLLEKSGGGDLQPVGFVTLFNHDFPAVCSNFIAKIELTSTVDPRYMCYLHAAAYYARINTRSIMQTTGIQNLDSDAYFNERVPIPPREEQTQIAAFLDAQTTHIDALIAEKKQQVELLDLKRQALITHAVTKGINPSAPLRPSGAEWFDAIPEHWEVMRVKYLSRKIGSGKTPRGGAEIYSGEGVLFLRSQNVYDDGLRLDDVVYVSEDLDEEMADTRVRSLDVLLNITGASIGRTCVVPKGFPPANVNQHVCIIRPRPDRTEPRFLSYCLKAESVKGQILSLESGSSRQGLNFEQVANLLVTLPRHDMQEQLAIADHLDIETQRLDAIADSINNQIGLLRKHRQVLITEAVTGTIDLRGV